MENAAGQDAQAADPLECDDLVPQLFDGRLAGLPPSTIGAAAGLRRRRVLLPAAALPDSAGTPRVVAIDPQFLPAVSPIVDLRVHKTGYRTRCVGRIEPEGTVDCSPSATQQGLAGTGRVSIERRLDYFRICTSSTAVFGLAERLQGKSASRWQESRGGWNRGQLPRSAG